MITVLNRKELCITLDMKKQAEIREQLQAHQIDYEIKTVNRTSPSSVPMGSDVRTRLGSAGQKTEQTYEYIFYVRKVDYEKARAAIKESCL